MTASIPHDQLLAVLRADQPLHVVLAQRQLTQESFQAALAEYLRSRVPDLGGTKKTSVRGPVQVLRDRHGVPHIAADHPHDLFFAYGYATAQDRLWQLDFLRRAGRGRLAEIMGPDSLPSDIEVRTVGIGRLADDLAARLPAATVEVLAAFAGGINAAREAALNNLPVEFEVLECSCEPWTVADSLALMKHFWWQLTGRLFLITGVELMKRALGEGQLYKAFLLSELHGETILPPGENRARPSEPISPGASGTGDSGPPGSNNWMIGPGKSVSGHALLASDPHTPYLAPTIWHEVHLHGAGYDVAGMGYVGVPGIIFGRNRRGAWGITNNICSLRDLFVYPPGHQSKTFQNRHPERIPVRGGSEHVLQLSESDLGPIVNHLLPPSIQAGPPVALRWVGAEVSDEVGALLQVNRAGSADEFHQALSGWACPTFNFVWADAAGDIAYQCAGRLPRRRNAERGLRQAADPRQQWAGHFPYECNPWCVNPKQGWLATANNPVLHAEEDPGLGGMFTSDARARRLRKLLEGRAKFTLSECAALQLDVFTERAPDVLPSLVAALANSRDEQTQTAVRVLQAWNGEMSGDSAAPAIFESFCRHWTRVILAERVPPEAHDLLTKHVFGLMLQLVKADRGGWFNKSDRLDAIQVAMSQALDELATCLGPDIETWRWDAIHTLTLRHALGKREALSASLNAGPRPMPGAGHTVNNQWSNMTGSYEAVSGANCRIAADLGTSELLITNCLGQSGHPGSPHYRDQFEDWLAGRLHVLSLDWERVGKEARHRLELKP